MHISLVGINHDGAPVAVREKVAIGSDKLPDALALLRSYVPQGIILSTCNRIEIYGIDSDSARAARATTDFLRQRVNRSYAELSPYLFTLYDEEAVAHLFSLTSGLESMIIGEYEILGQVGNALEMAEQAGMVGLPLRYIFQSAIRAGRRVREETGISKNALSVSSVAVELAAKNVGELAACKVMVIGVGEAGRLVAKAAKERGVRQIVVTSRTLARATALAEILGGKAIELSDHIEEITKCDIVITCASAPRRLLDAERVKLLMQARDNKPLVIIDIGVPRNVDPEAAQIKNVFLYNIDDLNQMAEANRKQREQETELARHIVDAEMEKFSLWRQGFKATPVVSALMQKAEEIRTAQLSKTLKKLRSLSDEEKESFEAMTRSIVTKILKGPVDYLKSNDNGDKLYAEVISELFQLDLKKK